MSKNQPGRSARPTETEIEKNSQGGFALALVMLALIGMTTMAMAGYLRSSTDYKINQNHRAATRAFYVSDAGRAQFLAHGRVASDTTTYSYSSGSVDVWMERLLDVDGSSVLFKVMASGTHNSAEGGVANRMTSSIVIWKPADLGISSAITAPAGFNKNGVSGSVGGFDEATSSDCPTGGLTDVAGLQIPPGGFSQSGGGGKGDGGSVPPGFAGAPAIDSTQSAYDMTSNIEWRGMLDGSFMEADYVVSEDGYPNFSADVGSDEWPIIRVDAADYAFSSTANGRGTLIVEGNAVFHGGFEWDGLILVGGELVSNGIQTIKGAVVAGLNIQLGQTPGPVDMGNGNWDYAFHSCNVLEALSVLGAVVEEPHSWLEVF